MVSSQWQADVCHEKIRGPAAIFHDFIVIRYCPFSLGVQQGREGSMCFILEEKIKLELFSRNFEKSTQFAWERVLTV